MENKLVAFLPCRSGSERVPEKNTKSFAGIRGGLFYIKMLQIMQCSKIDEVVVSTDDPKIFSLCNEFWPPPQKKLSVIKRPANLCTSSASTDELIEYLPHIIPEGDILWTHTTSPFIDEKCYSQAIDIFWEKRQEGENDSLMSVTKHQKFFWAESRPINYSPGIEKWPRTQTLNPIFEVNSGIFLANRQIYINLKNRIGNAPYFFETHGFQNIDIDWQEDFQLAEIVWKVQKCLPV